VRRRGVELGLLVLAVGLVLLGYVAVGLTREDRVPPDALRNLAVLAGLALLAHLVVRLRAPYADPLPLPIGVLLNGIGLVLIYRLDLQTPGDRAAPAQLVWSMTGFALFLAVVALLPDYRLLQRFAYLAMVAALVLMIVPI
ncbi:FtsW/RodA/SpoVE family cell cycle protein, partial [Streptomyces sp. SID11233]|nr:FtsW/RodA/SpoVE family cell cycle protein [Streptomyces sp. SID11233]